MNIDGNAVFARIKAPDEASLMKRVRPWVLGDGSVRAVLKRRDRIVAHLDRPPGRATARLGADGTAAVSGPSSRAR